MKTVKMEMAMKLRGEVENDHAAANNGNTRGVPESWAALASKYQHDRKFAHAAEAWRNAAGVTLGHSRAERYDAAARWCESQAEQVRS